MDQERLHPLTSYRFDTDRLELLQAILPEAFADGKINWEVLRTALGEHLEDDEPTAEHFGLFWPGKREARRRASQPSKGTLVPVPGEGVNEATTRNIFIEADNLEALKLLQKSYAGRVKTIYIDPPYNTGNDFVYRDDFKEESEDYLQRTGQVDEKLNPLTTNTKADGRFHSNWLNMMYPRLLLARTLLREDGLIFITIDDNELHHLRSIMDEVFGPENFIANIAWEKRFTRSNNARLFYSLKDSILVYRRSSVVDVLREQRTEKSDSIYKNPDNDPRGSWTSSSYVNPATKAQRPNLVYPLTNPFTGETIEHPTHAWKYEKAEHERHVREKRLWWGKDGDAKYPRLKVFLSESDGGLVPIDVWDYKSSGTTDEGGAEVKNIFGEAVFDNPKPTKLIKRILKLATSNDDNDIVLDFFAGSGTTAQAVLELNKEDGGNRQFILVQVAEETSVDSVAHKAGYQVISEITQERIRRVMKKMEDERNGRLPEGDAPDLGFRLYRYASSNYKPWEDYNGDDIGAIQRQFSTFEVPLVDGWREDDLLTEVMLLQGFPLDSRIETLVGFSTNTIRRVTSDFHAHSLTVCLDANIAEVTLVELELDSDDVFVCLDSALTDENKFRFRDRCVLRVI
jgi:adenine-specific DNA-methyltransferase